MKIEKIREANRQELLKFAMIVANGQNGELKSAFIERVRKIANKILLTSPKLSFKNEGSIMKSNELRIGNYVKDGKEIRQVEGWMFIQLTKDLEPIPLTPEILDMCNLLPDGIFPDVEYFSIKEGSLYFNGEYTAAEEIKYLHQFQNLYHSLTGNELEINL